MAEMSKAGRNELLSVAEVATRLRVSGATVYCFVSAGVLPAIQLAGPRSTIRFDPKELEAWLRSPGGHTGSIPPGERSEERT
jgi:excisionase family DNA binding protein